MVVVRLVGGLGNQMFQYAAGRALATRLGVELALDVGSFANDKLRRYELGAWCIRARVIGENSECRSLDAASALSRAINMFKDFSGLGASRLKTFREASFSYDARFRDVEAPVRLEGYFQSERYFVDSASALRAEFTPRDKPDAANQSVLDAIKAAGCRSVSVHIRRGDYVTDPRTAEYHGICSLDYYRASIGHVRSVVGEPQAFVFSDDMSWVKNNLKLDCDLMWVDVNDGWGAISDMWLMRSCRHHVIANSSFSWWAAWLNPSQDKIVVSPRQWFRGAQLDTGDLIPASWVRL